MKVWAQPTVRRRRGIVKSDEVVHAHGRITVRDDERFVRGVIARLTRTHEAQEPRPWKMGDSAPESIDAMLQSIVGIEITLTHLEAKAKLSQNREPRDRLGAIEAQRQRGESGRCKADLFHLSSTHEPAIRLTPAGFP